MKPGRPKGPATKTPALLDKLHQYITEQFQPPFYETPNTRQIGAAMGMSHTQAARYLEYLVQDGRLLRSPSGKLVPAPRYKHSNEDMIDAVRYALHARPLIVNPERIEDGTGREWLNLGNDVLSKYAKPTNIDEYLAEIDPTQSAIARSIRENVQTPPETHADQPPSNPPD